MQEFEKVYLEYVKDVYKFLLKLSGSPDVAEELTQSTFAIAFEKMDEFRGTCKMSVWLCQIAKHEYYAYYKEHKSLVPETDEDAVYAARGPDGGASTLEERLVRREEQLEIHRILHGLPEPYKEVFTLRVMAELSYKDISRLFHKSESWARVTYYRAKCMITERLGGEADDEV